MIVYIMLGVPWRVEIVYIVFVFYVYVKKQLYDCIWNAVINRHVLLSAEW